MNNIFLPNDPLLYNQQLTDYRQLYELKLMKEREMFDKQYNEYMKNSILASQPKIEDKISELNVSLKNASTEIKEQLQKNEEFVLLNQALQDSVLAELVELVKNNINSNPDLVSNINKQIKIINDLSDYSKEQDRKNMALINDYLKNYSDMTFDEYKKLKNI